MRVIKKLKLQNGWEGKGNHHCEGFRPSLSHPRSHSQQFLFVLAFKETSGWPEVSQRWRGEKRSHYMVAFVGGRVLWHWNTKTHTQAKLMPWQR